MRVVFMGTPDIAATCLKKILADGFDVVGVYTQPDRPKGRGNKMLMTPVKEYALSKGYEVSVGRIGKLECDFVMRSPEMDYAYVQVALTIMLSRETEDREYRPLEQIRDNYPKYVVTRSDVIQRRGGIKHVNALEFMLEGGLF